ncbi:hypothetical protein HJFPF1_09461 [Paramyrothecium foliicola]|nr:hypothetical protein HJFPF1_09461 [Paramyrothecium foliicola]
MLKPSSTKSSILTVGALTRDFNIVLGGGEAQSSELWLHKIRQVGDGRHDITWVFNLAKNQGSKGLTGFL